MTISDQLKTALDLSRCREKNGIIFAIPGDELAKRSQELGKRINILKTALKKFPRVYSALHTILSPGWSPVFRLTPSAAIKKYLKNDALIINCGAGTRKIPGAINADLFPFAGVSIVANAENLPFKNESIDMIVCESLLEHIERPEKVFAEFRRIIKPGGYIYVAAPFMYPYHDSPGDYFRWTKTGLEIALEGFIPIKSGIKAGPAATLQGHLMSLLAMPLSLGIYPLYLFWQLVFMVLLSPLKLLDFLFQFFPMAHEISGDLWLFARKK